METTALDGVLILTPRRHGDDRGYFAEIWNRETLKSKGLDLDFRQENHSKSAAPGTIRGLHYQAPPHAQDKLVRVVAGRVLDVAVDVREGSATYGQWVGVELDADGGRQLLIPKGFLHGFVTWAPETEVVYLCTDVYAPECDGAVHFADPEIGVDWGIDPADAIVSAKDARAPSLAEFRTPFALEPA